MKQSGNTREPGLSRRSTMADVAKRANVAISTVSHVLNGTAPISAEATEKIYAAMKELHYTPNALARGLRRQRTKVIGLIVPEIRNEFYACCASAVLQAADREDYTVLVCDCCYDLQREKRSVHALMESRADGLIFFGGAGDEALIHQARQAGIAVVLGDRSLEDFPSVEFTNVETMRAVIRLLYERGKRRFCYVSEPIEMRNLMERYNGFLLGIDDCGLAVTQQQLVVEKRFQNEKIDSARKMIAARLTQPNFSVPDVFIASCDAIAIGIISGLNAAGLRVPEDVGVVGFDNMNISAHTAPPLTTVSQDTQRVGEEAFGLLHKLLSSEGPEQRHILIKSELIIRGSVS